MMYSFILKVAVSIIRSIGDTAKVGVKCSSNGGGGRRTETARQWAKWLQGEQSFISTVLTCPLAAEGHVQQGLKFSVRPCSQLPVIR